MVARSLPQDEEVFMVRRPPILRAATARLLLLLLLRRAEDPRSDANDLPEHMLAIDGWRWGVTSDRAERSMLRPPPRLGANCVFIEGVCSTAELKRVGEPGSEECTRVDRGKAFVRDESGVAETSSLKRGKSWWHARQIRDQMEGRSRTNFASSSSTSYSSPSRGCSCCGCFYSQYGHQADNNID